MELLPWDVWLPARSLLNARVTARARVLVDAIERRPHASFNALFDTRAATKASYRFVNHSRLTLATVCAPACAAVGHQVATCADATTLAVHDTTEFDRTALRTATGFGPLTCPTCRGLFLHATLAVTDAGVPLGPLAMTTWARDPATHGIAATRRARPFDQKESARWWHSVVAAEDAVGVRGRLLHVADREADIYELIARAAAAAYRVLFRADGDRGVVGAQALLGDAVAALPVVATTTLELPARPARNGKPARAARTAQLVVHAGAVTLRAPHGAAGTLPVWAVFATERGGPADDGIEWLLLTTDAITTAAAAQQALARYATRWVIEEFFKCLKTGCRAEHREADTRATFEVGLAVRLLVAARLLHLTKLARVAAPPAAATVLDADELAVVAAHATRLGAPPPARPDMTWAVTWIARLGGYLARPSDGPPGWLTLGRGYTRLCEMVDGYRLMSAVARGAPPESS